MVRYISRVLCCAALALVAQAAIVSAQTAGEPIKIGAVLSLTGPGAGIGQPERLGILLAEQAVNARGGHSPVLACESRR